MKEYKVTCDRCSVSVINGVSCHERGCLGHLIYTYRGKRYEKFRVYSLDVWGNAKDGFEVNDRSQIGQILLPENFWDCDLIKALKRKGLRLTY